MAATTGIAYVHHTRNFWSGCTKTGPGCDGCYAEAFNRWIRGRNPETGQAKNWGPGTPRIQHLAGAIKDLKRWHHNATDASERRRVFVNTNSDTFDNEVPDDWRAAIWECVALYDGLDYLFVTKRIGNVARMVPPAWMHSGFPSNVRVLSTICNQPEADRDIPKLLALPCKNGISYEPALGPVDWLQWLWPTLWHFDKRYNSPQEAIAAGAYAERKPQKLGARYRKTLDWVIIGGESAQPGHPARPFDLAWARSTVEQCRAAGVPVFVKQLGSEPRVKVWGIGFPVKPAARLHQGIPYGVPDFKDHAGADPEEWPADLRVREYPA